MLKLNSLKKWHPYKCIYNYEETVLIKPMCWKGNCQMQLPEEHLMYKVPTHIYIFPSFSPSYFFNFIACDSPVRSWRAILCYGPVRPWRPGASSISCAASELHLELHRELSASYRPLGALLSYTIHTHAQSSQQTATTQTHSVTIF